jgi:preprotein translocase subunit SecD
VGWTSAVPYSAAVLAEEVRIVQERVDATGAVGVVVSSDGADRLNVSIPASLDAGPLRSLVGQTGRIAFVPLGDKQVEKGDSVDPAAFPELFGSEGVASATVSTDQNAGRVVVFELTPAAAAEFGTYTAAHIGTYFAITLDGLIVSAPVINSEIAGGSVEISQAGAGGWDLAEANELATIIRLKPLPVPLTEITNARGPVDPSAAQP